MTTLRAALAAVLAAVSLNAAGQGWPQKPVKFILSLGPGSGADIGARLYADWRACSRARASTSRRRSSRPRRSSSA